QVAPGPLAAQLAIYLGWVRARVLGATLVAAAFILPSFLMVLGLSALYLRFGGLPSWQCAFYGVGAAVIAVIARSAVKLVRITLSRDWLLWGLFVVNGAVTAWTESEIVWVFLLSGCAALLVRAPPRLGKGTAGLSLAPCAWLVSGLTGPAAGATLLHLGLYFAEAGAVVFRRGLGVVPVLPGGGGDRL